MYLVHAHVHVHVCVHTSSILLFLLSYIAGAMAASKLVELLPHVPHPLHQVVLY